MTVNKTIQRTLFFILADMLITLFSVFIAFELRFDFSIPDEYYPGLYAMIVILLSTRFSLFIYFNIYSISWRHFGFNDTTKVISVVGFSTFVLLVLTYFVRYLDLSIVIPRSTIAIEFFISLFLILALRVTKRLYLEKFQANALGKYTLIVAKLDNANSILRAINHNTSNYFPIAVIDDKYDGVKINGVNVYSFKSFKKSDLGFEAIIVDETVDIASLYNKLNVSKNIDVKVASQYSDYETKLQDISVEDLLARHPKDLDKEKIKSFIENKVILITGAGGSIGSEICRQCEKYGAKKLILIDHSEYNLYAILEELREIEVVPVMQSVLHKKEIENIFKKYNPQIVIHAAAYKHVPLVEANIDEAIRNNIIGTKNVIDISIKSNVQKLVLISTDKAVRPTNVMGTTKRICELYAQNSNGQGTEIVAVRFGNVLGSSGSVIPKFKRQIEEGGPITVTHPDITRYFMLISEACELVLQAGAIAKGGEIFILDMGEPVKIVDMAKKMIDLSGKENIEIKFTGLRPGEKLYEELLLDESDATTEYESITVAMPTLYDLRKLNQDIKELLESKNKIMKLKEIVPEFNHK
jgi:UDP-N-acetyl-D-glucosamine 4,6-dehydratase